MKPAKRIPKQHHNRHRKPHSTEEQVVPPLGTGLDGEVFDAITQSLFSLTLTLRAARQGSGHSTDETERLLDSAEDLAQHTLSEMCAITFDLRPEAHEQAGLASSLQTHVRALQARSGLNIHFDVKGDRRLPFELEEALYQSTRAALQEVVRHDQATDCWVELDLEGDKVYISIRDNSPGFTDFRFSLSDSRLVP